MLVTIKRNIGKFVRQSEDLVHFISHKMKNTTYAEYYAERQNRIVRRNPNWGLNMDKSFQLDFLRKHAGLKPDTVFLDFGCGALAAGAHFIEFLNPGKYLGIDVSESAIDEGKKRINKNGLISKNPIVLKIEPGDLSPVSGTGINFIWANSVLTHMSPEDIEKLLGDFKNQLGENFVFYATFARSNSEVKHKRFKDWYYPPSKIKEMAEKNGYDFEILTNWVHPMDPDGHDTLGKFCPKRA